MSQQSEDDRFELFGVEVVPPLVARAQRRRLHVHRLAPDLGGDESLRRSRLVRQISNHNFISAGWVAGRAP